MLQVTEILVPHWSQVRWDEKRWPNFHPSEFSSPDNGELYYWPEFFDRIQLARSAVGKPFHINSAHRSWRENIRVGGAPMSEHKRLAVDISLRGHNRFQVLSSLRGAGFTGIGLYQTFIHADLGVRRSWFGGSVSERIWRSK